MAGVSHTEPARAQGRAAEDTPLGRARAHFRAKQAELDGQAALIEVMTGALCDGAAAAGSDGLVAARQAAEAAEARGAALAEAGWSAPRLLAVAEALERNASVRLRSGEGAGARAPLWQVLDAAGESDATAADLRDEAGRTVTDEAMAAVRSARLQSTARLGRLAAAAGQGSAKHAVAALRDACAAGDRIEGAHGALVAEAVARRAATMARGLRPEETAAVEAELAAASASAPGSLAGGASVLAHAGAVLLMRARAAAAARPADADTGAGQAAPWEEEAAASGWRLLARSAVALGRWDGGSKLSFGSVHFHAAEAALAALRSALLAEAEAEAASAVRSHGRSAAVGAAAPLVAEAAASLELALAAVAPVQARHLARVTAREALLWVAASPAPLRDVGVLDGRAEAQDAGDAVDDVIERLCRENGVAAPVGGVGASLGEPGVAADAASLGPALEALLPEQLFRGGRGGAGAGAGAGAEPTTKKGRKRAREAARAAERGAAQGVAGAALAEFVRAWLAAEGSAPRPPVTSATVAALAKHARAMGDGRAALSWVLEPWAAARGAAEAAGLSHAEAEALADGVSASWGEWGPGRLPARALLQAARAAHDMDDAGAAMAVLETARLAARTVAAAEEAAAAAEAGGAVLTGSRAAADAADEIADSDGEVPTAELFDGSASASEESEDVASAYSFGSAALPASSQTGGASARPARPPTHAALDDIREAAARAALVVAATMPPADAFAVLAPSLDVPSLSGPQFVPVHDALVARHLDAHDADGARAVLDALARRGRRVSADVLDRLVAAADTARVAESLAAAEAVGRSSLPVTGYQPWHVPSDARARAGFLRALARIPAASPPDAARFLEALPTGVMARAVRGRFLEAAGAGAGAGAVPGAWLPHAHVTADGSADAAAPASEHGAPSSGPAVPPSSSSPSSAVVPAVAPASSALLPPQLRPALAAHDQAQLTYQSALQSVEGGRGTGGADRSAGGLAASLGLTRPDAVASAEYRGAVAGGRDERTARGAEALGRSRQRFESRLPRLAEARAGGDAAPGSALVPAPDGGAAADAMPGVEALAEARPGTMAPVGPAEVVAPPLPRDPPTTLILVRAAGPSGAAPVRAAQWSLLAGVAARLTAEPQVSGWAWRLHTGLVGAWRAAVAARDTAEAAAIAEAAEPDPSAAGEAADPLGGSRAVDELLGGGNGSAAGSEAGGDDAGGWLAELELPPPLAPLLSDAESSRLRSAMAARAAGVGEGGDLRQSFAFAERLQTAGLELEAEDAGRLVRACCRLDQPRRAEATAEWAEDALGLELPWTAHAALARAWAGAGAVSRAEARLEAMLAALPEVVSDAGEEAARAVRESLADSMVAAGAQAEAAAERQSRASDAAREEAEDEALRRLPAGSPGMRRLPLPLRAAPGAGVASGGPATESRRGGAVWGVAEPPRRAGAVSALVSMGLWEPVPARGRAGDRARRQALAGRSDDDGDGGGTLVAGRVGLGWSEASALHEAEETVALVAEAAAAAGSPSRAVAVLERAAASGVMARVLGGAPSGLVDVTPLRDEAAGCVLFESMTRLRRRAAAGRAVPDTLTVAAAGTSLVHVRAVLQGLSPPLRATLRLPAVQWGAGGVALPCVPRVEVSSEDLTAWLTAPVQAHDRFEGAGRREDPWEAEADDWDAEADAAEAERQRQEYAQWHQRWAVRRAEARLLTEEAELSASRGTDPQLRRQLRKARGPRPERA